MLYHLSYLGANPILSIGAEAGQPQSISELNHARDVWQAG